MIKESLVFGAVRRRMINRNHKAVIPSVSIKGFWKAAETTGIEATANYVGRGELPITRVKAAIQLNTIKAQIKISYSY